MMKKDNLVSSLLGSAALLFVAAAAVVMTSCTQDENEPGGTPSEGKITLVPTVDLTPAWGTGDDSPGTRADATVAVKLICGEICVALANPPATGGSPNEEDLLCCNYYSVSAEGKLTRLSFAGRPNETEAPLAVDAPGNYYVAGTGDVTLETDGISYSSYLRRTFDTEITIGGDGKLTLPLKIGAAGLRLNVKNNDGTAYTGADITATLKNLYPYGKPFEAKTLTASAPAVIWGDLWGGNVNKGDQLLELAVAGGKTYKVNAPRQISFTYARLYTFNVRVGATGIEVSSDDLAVGDFEVEAVTNVEAEVAPAPIHAGNTVYGVNGYWVTAPGAEDAKYEWAASSSATAMNTDPCAGNGNWRMPTMKDFEKMAGWNEVWPWSQEVEGTDKSIASDAAVWNTAFPSGIYWSLVARTSDTGAWNMYSYGNGTASYSWSSKTTSNYVRCVQVQ